MYLSLFFLPYVHWAKNREEKKRKRKQSKDFHPVPKNQNVKTPIVGDQHYRKKSGMYYPLQYPNNILHYLFMIEFQ